MTDQIPADKVREIVEKMLDHADNRYVTDVERRNIMVFADQLAGLLPPPPLPTLADMTEEERDACQWMQADVEGEENRTVVLLPNASGGRALVLSRWGDVVREDHAAVTPRPDLPRMMWPGDQEPAPAPALPDGWRLADHPDYGRVIVTAPTPNSDGHVYFTAPAAGRMGYGCHWCEPDQLAYVDQEDDQ